MRASCDSDWFCMCYIYMRYATSHRAGNVTSSRHDNVCVWAVGEHSPGDQIRSVLFFLPALCPYKHPVWVGD